MEFTFDVTERGDQRRKALKLPLALRFRGNSADIRDLSHLGRFICNKKRKWVDFYGKDFSFWLHRNLNWFPLPATLLSRKSIQFRGP